MTGEVIHEESSLHREDGNRREEGKWERSCEELPTVGLGLGLGRGTGPVIYRTFPACCRCNDGFEVSPVF